MSTKTENKRKLIWTQGIFLDRASENVPALFKKGIVFKGHT